MTRKCTCIDCEGRFKSKKEHPWIEKGTCRHCFKKVKLVHPNMMDFDVQMCSFCLNCGKCNSIWHCHCNAEPHYSSYYYDDEDQEDHVSGHCSKCGHYFDIMCPSDEEIKKITECACN